MNESTRGGGSGAHLAVASHGAARRPHVAMLLHVPLLLGLVPTQTLKVSLGGLSAPITTQQALTPASLAVAQYIAALPDVALVRRSVLCEDFLCASAAEAAGGKVNRTWLASFDLADLASPLPMTGQTKPKYGTGIGTANLVVMSDVLSTEEDACCMAARVAECIQLGAWVIVGDTMPSPHRAIFLEKLEAELRFVDCGFPVFDDPCVVEQPSLGWMSETVQLLRMNAPGFAPALNTGYNSLEERRGHVLPSPVVEVSE